MRAKRADPIILLLVISLLGLGLMMVYSSSAILALEYYGDPYHYLKRQALWAGLGLLAVFTLMRVDYRIFSRLAYPILVLSLLLLVLVFVPGLGKEVGGARRWLRLGSFSFQPAEFAKFALVIFLASFMAKKGERLRDFTFGFLPCLLIASVFIILVALQPDLGGALILGALVMVLFFAGGVRISYLLSTLFLALPFLYGALFSVAYRRRRILAFIDPWEHHSDSGYQVIQSLLALARGGLSGLGLGQGKMKLFYLPEPHTDFIFSVVGEELGFLGTVALVVAFALLCWRLGLVALRAKEPFGALLALGFATLFGLQFFVHSGVALGLLPTKGLPLPLISVGGSSLLASLLALGTALSVSARGHLPPQGGS